MNRFQSDCFLVDNGLVEHITTCPTKANYKYVYGKSTAAESAALRFGRNIHTALAYHNKMQFFGKEPKEDVQLRILENRFLTTPTELEGWRNLDSAIKVIRGYNASPMGREAHIKAHPVTGLPMVEHPFAIDTKRVVQGYRIIYIGRIDRTTKMPEGTFVRDYKTTSMLGDSFWSEAAISEQYRGYCWAYRESTGEEPIGYCVDAIGIRESLQNAVWDDVLQKVVPPKNSKAVPLSFETERFFTAHPSGQLDEWFENMLQQVDTFLFHLKKNVFPRHHYHCRMKYGLCEYYDVCSLPERSRESVLNSNAFQENKWTPLYRR